MQRGLFKNPLILLLLFASFVSSKTLTQKATLEQSSQPKCFDYTTTLFDVDTDNDLGFTTGFTMDPQRQCMIDIKSGITRIPLIRVSVKLSIASLVMLAGEPLTIYLNIQIIIEISYNNKKYSIKAIKENDAKLNHKKPKS